jgi:hypothetical protein
MRRVPFSLKWSLGLLVLGVPAIFACKKTQAVRAGAFVSAPSETAMVRNQAPQATPGRSEQGRTVSRSAAPPMTIAPEPRKLIRTGGITVEVQDFHAASEKAASIALRFGGYVAGSRASRDEAGKYSGDLVFRIPAERFDAAFRELASLGHLEAESLNTEDVTKAYFDLEGRLRVARDAEARIREILRTRAARLADVLEAERELSRIVGEIEQMEGEHRFYDRQTALSTINATFHEPQSLARPGSLGPLRQAVHDSAGALATSVAALIYLVMYGLPWALLAALLWILIRRARRARRQQPPPKPE